MNTTSKNMKWNGSEYIDYRPFIASTGGDADSQSVANSDCTGREVNQPHQPSAAAPVSAGDRTDSTFSRIVGGASRLGKVSADFLLCASMLIGLSLGCIRWEDRATDWTMTIIGLGVAIAAGRIAGYIHRNDCDPYE